VTQRTNLAGPEMGCGARLHTNQTGPQALEKEENLVAPQLTLQNGAAGEVSTLHLKNVLGISKPTVVTSRMDGSRCSC
jgi:hypothetical protein